MVAVAKPVAVPTVSVDLIDPDHVVGLVRERQAEIRDVLSRGMWHRRRPRDPELRKILGRLFICLSEARRLAVDNEHLTPTVRASLSDLLGMSVDGLTVDSAAELIDSVDMILIEIGDRRFITDLVVLEACRDRHKKEMEAQFVTWSSLFERVPQPLVASDDTPGAADGAELKQSARDAATLEVWRSQLAALRRSRSTEYRLHRARLGMKARSLMLTVPVLVALVAGTAALVIVTEGSEIWPETLLSVFAGALGGAVSGAYKLKDHVSRIGDFRALWPARFVQPLLGATAGLIALLTLVSGFLPQNEAADDGTWAKYAVVAFVAGFSEPFFLGLVGKIGGTLAEPSGEQKPT